MFESYSVWSLAKMSLAKMSKGVLIRGKYGEGGRGDGGEIVKREEGRGKREEGLPYINM